MAFNWLARCYISTLRTHGCAPSKNHKCTTGNVESCTIRVRPRKWSTYRAECAPGQTWMYFDYSLGCNRKLATLVLYMQRVATCAHLFRRACVLKNVDPYVGWIVCLLVRVLVRPFARVFVRWCVRWSVRSAKTGCGLSWKRPVRSRTHPFRLCMRNVTQCRGCAVVRTMLVMVVDWFAPGKTSDLSSVINRWHAVGGDLPC